MASRLSYVTLDVFTSTRYLGNPLAIVTVPQDTILTQDQKQRISREFNFSESVFLHEQTQQDRDDQSVRIDIFTRQAEIPFAGHPTVGAANHLLRLLKNNPLNRVKALQAKAGRFPIALDPAISGVRISVAHNVHIHASPFNDTPFGHYPVVSIVKGMTFILAQLPDLESLAAQSQHLLTPPKLYTAKDKLDHGWREGLVVSYFYVDLGPAPGPVPSETGATQEVGIKVRQLRTRGFGSAEDPATGSAACALASYLSLQEGKVGRYRYLLTQGVEMGRKSQICVDVCLKARENDNEHEPGLGVEIDQVLLSGSAVQVMQGTLEIPDV